MGGRFTQMQVDQAKAVTDAPAVPDYAKPGFTINFGGSKPLFDPPGINTNMPIDRAAFDANARQNAELQTYAATTHSAAGSPPVNKYAASPQLGHFSRGTFGIGVNIDPSNGDTKVKARVAGVSGSTSMSNVKSALDRLSPF